MTRAMLSGVRKTIDRSSRPSTVCVSPAANRPSTIGASLALANRTGSKSGGSGGGTRPAARRRISSTSAGGASARPRARSRGDPARARRRTAGPSRRSPGSGESRADRSLAHGVTSAAAPRSFSTTHRAQKPEPLLQGTPATPSCRAPGLSFRRACRPGVGVPETRGRSSVRV